MRPTRARRAESLLLAGAAGVLFSAPAAAETDGAHFSYSAPAGCPDEVAFLDLVALDGGSLVRRDADEPARTLAVTVEGAETFSGRLVIREVDGTDAERRIEGERCEDVARALAVLVALALEVPPSPPSPAAELPPATGEFVWPAPEPPQDREAREAENAWRPRWRVAYSVGWTLSGGTGGGMLPGLATQVESFAKRRTASRRRFASELS